MKRILLIISLGILIVGITACDTNKGVTHMGVNAEVLEVSKQVKGMIVRGDDKNSILGEKCYINCEGQDVYFIYVNNRTGETIDLQFGDFIVGDEITVDVEPAENKYAKTSRVQLITQRK